jgi:hypothetical protein
MVRQRLALIALVVCAATAAVCLAVPRLTPANAAQGYGTALDIVAKQYSVWVKTGGELTKLAGPRMVYDYTPAAATKGGSYAGRLYVFVPSSKDLNPEVVMAVELSGDPAHPTVTTELSRMSGWAMEVHRGGKTVALFPGKPWVEGAYVGFRDK